MTETATRAQIDDYLTRLNAALAPLGEEKRAQLVTDIATHIRESLDVITDPSEIDVRDLLERIGDPEDIAAEAADVDPSNARGEVSGVQENLAIALLLVGGFLFIVGWIIGVVLLWTSSLWRIRDKLIGTFFLPGGLLPALLLVGGLSSESSSETCSGEPIVCSTRYSHSGLPVPLRDSLLIAALVIPVVTAVYLARRRRLLASSSVKPMTKKQWFIGGVVALVVVMALGAFLILRLRTTGTTTSSSGSTNPLCIESTPQCLPNHFLEGIGSGFAPDVSSPAVRDWSASHRAVIEALIDNMATFPNPLPADHSRTLLAKCDALRSALDGAESLQAIPDEAAQSKWANVLSSVSTASADCIAGISQSDPALLAKVDGEMTSASESLALMIFGVEFSAGNGTTKVTETFR